ncbi:Putative SWI/SNF-related matrix-associated actin-dependent regulator of chromatin subfamily A member 3-like [Olea europaea subsp. europaea]|uniref:SWI/SNF-related matrix-associated actin-dependent regulator of chromatin subfamily A member 3-like n=1 Tax=Olea europaea subsp. europaea TaxID=158383 RepID=A0A8S0V8T3_OLEEU|nr:Putative SWI/SNF-related matrix-associated actin-dependent regulator of chromatin subfamily A member 3-like [Olea europaea subsp. europaea]
MIKRFIVKGTVEERMEAVQARKQQMISGALTDQERRKKAPPHGGDYRAPNTSTPSGFAIEIIETREKAKPRIWSFRSPEEAASHWKELFGKLDAQE